ncbi:hypothetical protein FS837_006217 [Tulasnella sp. UAMH 9824]|nr:hypothetical protein FS837_006217 [Tulasnella sp. UAMH 9824]
MVLPVTYRIRNVQGGLYLDEDEGTIRGWANEPHKDSQKWVFEPAGNGWHIKNIKTNLYVSSSGDSDDHGLKASSNKDVWLVYNHGSGYSMTLKGGIGLQVIDLLGGGSKKGTPVNIVPWIDNAEQNAQQLWELEEVTENPQFQDKYKGPIPAGTYRIHNVLNNDALELLEGKSDDGTRVHHWPADAGPHQNWIFELGTKGYRIKNGASGTYLHNEKYKAGSQLTCRSAFVEWTVTQADRGFMIHTAKDESTWVIDLESGVTLRPDENKEAQKWRIELVV